MKVVYSNNSITPVQLTAPDGNTYVLLNQYTDTQDGNKVKGTVALGTQTGTKSASLPNGDANANWSVVIYNSEDTNTPLSGTALDVALSDLKAKGGTWTISASSTGRTRISEYAAGRAEHVNDVYAAASKAISDLGSLSFASGAASLTISKTIYYSIAGQANDVTPTVGTVQEVETAGSVQGNISINLAYSAE
ncbi:MAG: hypothetical protein IJU64_07100 [Bacilli bacterium]|nr:hypothetical protein [Bacilli bacterium]